MAYCRGSKDDYGRWAQVTDDEGWSWNSLQPYIHKIKNLSPSADNPSIIDEIDVSIHGSGGPVSFSLPGQLLPTDEHAINTSSELSAEFPFNLDYSSGDTIGVGWTQAMIAKGQHVTSAAAYLIPTMSRPNLDIIANSQVTKILQTGTKDGQPVFSAIQFYTVGDSEIHTINASKEIIISAGAIKTPQLLMLSGIGEKDYLSTLGIDVRVDVPDVGQNLQ
ncbi:glucose-methanol-choline oxidoreductase [Lentinula aff. lateritia]|uniref:Glucose-methanol-choline oxidoreductase n=1 Tax=Lentinula aff. lateritia TaxID=2804960 RepID=A0ACC1TIT4_9AGAR|nr:glucose-methanol-choline oxidoreductase [Lentinula aff. lateritia]